MSENKRLNKVKEILWISPILFVIGVIPLMMQVRPVTLSAIERVLYHIGKEVNYDIYTKVKAEFLLYCTGVALILFLIQMLRRELRIEFRWFVIPVFIYTGSAIVSTIAARYRAVFNANYEGVISNAAEVSGMSNLGVYGFMDHFEGVQTLMCYVILFFVSYYMVNTSFQKKVLINVLLFSGCIMAVGALLQYFGIYFHDTQLGLRFILGRYYEELKDHFNYKLGQYYSVGTLYNPNYLGGYSAVVLMVAIGQFFNHKNDTFRVWWKDVEGLWYFISALLIYTCLLTSNSSTGILAAIIGGLFFVAISIKKLIKQWKKVLSLVLMFAGVVIILNGLSSKRIDGEFSSMGDELEMISGTYEDRRVLIESAEYLANGLKIISEDMVLIIALDGENIHFVDEDLNIIPAALDEKNVIRLKDERYRNVSATYIGGNAGLSLRFEGKGLTLKFDEDNGISVLGSGAIGFPLDKEVEMIGFEGNESFASNRGYIWSRTFPLLKESIILGYGPDSYVAVFPQYDVLGKSNHMYQTTMLVDKPHNLYMQIWTQTGFLSLLVLIILVLGSIVGLVKSEKKINVKGWSGSVAFLGLASALFVFAVQGIANDSTIPITAIVWVLLGLSVKMCEDNNIAELNTIHE